MEFKERLGLEDDKNIPYDDDVEYDEVDDLNEDNLHLDSGLGDNIKDANNKLGYSQEDGILNEDVGQRNHFNNKNQNIHGNNPNLVSDVDEGSVESYDDFNYGNDPRNNNENNQYLEDEEDDCDDSAINENDDQDTTDICQPEELTGQDRRRNRHSGLPWSSFLTRWKWQVRTLLERN